MADDLAFRYVGYDVDTGTGTLRCRYSVGGFDFEEVVTVEGDHWGPAATDEAARLVFLLAGVSYYKAFAPPTIDVGSTPLRDGERAFLAEFYREGLGEFAYRNDLDLRIEIVGGASPTRSSPPTVTAASASPRPLVPFGGGMDSIVSVELLRPVAPDAALFVVGRPGDRYQAIEEAAAVTGLPIVRATRALDPTILRSAEFGFLNGHVPVTGVLSAIAVLAAVVGGRDAVVMSNEWSASVGTAVPDGRVVNHQYSKSVAFERGFRAVLAEALGPTPDYFSLLRPFTELWIARRFAEHPEYRKAFRSCNRAFHVEPAARLDRWCGRCDKCAFIDLILSPFVPAADLVAVFDGAEPLGDATLLDQFRALVGAGADVKPFECVGDVDECRAAVVLAADRDDRRGPSSSASGLGEGSVLAALLADLGPEAVTAARASVAAALRPVGEHFVPEPYAAAAGLD